MGFDNDCILNIQSLPGEYFCPVCRTLICPNEALQTQCTHLYCKPCLAYVAATTQACPYDGYLVTEADSKPLVDLNKSLAETIGKVAVHCLYNKSGCQWQGNLSECITHGTTCAYGNSPVVCNRCGTQIVHRQVHEHAQLCPGVQPQAQQADSSLTQSSAATTQAVTQDPSAVSSVAPAAVPSATAAGVVTASAVATTSAGVTTTSTMAVASFAGAPTVASQGQAVAPQTQTAEQYQQQLQYQQYYQQHYPGYNPYTQQYQQYGQYQQYTQPQTQVAIQNAAQVPGQLASYAQPQYLQPSQPQHMVPNQPQNQSHHPQLQAPVQPQPQPNPQLHSAPQNPPMHPQGDVQPIAHTQVGSQQFAVPTTQAIASQVQPLVQPHPPQHQQAVAQHQHPQMQFLPQQQHLQSQIQYQQPQVQQSYPQPQVYHQPHPVAQPQNPSVHAVVGHQSYSQPQPTHQMPHSVPLQRPAHASHQQLVGPQHPAPHPLQGQIPLQGQQPAMLAPQGTQHTSQHQQHIGHHVQRPPVHPSIPSQALQQGFPLNTSVPSQTGQSYQQGMHSSQQHMHSQPFQPHGPPFMQQQHVPTSTSRSMSNAATLHQFQQSGKSENAPNATRNTELGDSTNGGGESSGIKLESLGDKNVNGEQNDFGSTRKNVEQTGIALGSVDGSDKGKEKDEFGGQKSNSQSEASNISNDLEKGGSLQQASQKDLGALGSYVPPGMGRHRPTGPDTLLPQHMLHPSQTNQMRPPSHSFSENIRPTMQQQPSGFQSEMVPRTLAPNLPWPAHIRSDDGMIRPPMGGPLHGHHDTTMPPFAPENVGRPHPAGMTKSNGFGSGPLGNSRAFLEEGFNSSQEHFRSLAPPYPGRYNVDPKDIEENMKPFPGPSHLDGDGFQRGPRPFDGFDSLPGRPPFSNKPGSYPVGFPEDLSRKPHSIVGHPDFVSPGAEFGLHRIDGMPRNPGSFLQGMTAGPGGLRKDQLGPGNLPGNLQHDFGKPGFPHTHFHPGDTFHPRNLHGVEPLGHLHGIEPSGHRFHGHIHPDDPNLDDYSRHGFPQESGRFSSGGFFSNGDVGWCRICMFNCGSAEDLGLHVHTREHQQHAMDIVLKMKHDVAKRQKMNPGGPKSFNKKVAMKGNFRGNRR